MNYKDALIFLIDGNNICERPHNTAMFSSREKKWQMAIKHESLRIEIQMTRHKFAFY